MNDDETKDSKLIGNNTDTTEIVHNKIIMQTDPHNLFNKFRPFLIRGEIMLNKAKTIEIFSLI